MVERLVARRERPRATTSAAGAPATVAGTASSRQRSRRPGDAPSAGPLARCDAAHVVAGRAGRGSPGGSEVTQRPSERITWAIAAAGRGVEVERLLRGRGA